MPQIPFSLLTKSMTHYAFLESLPTVADNVCDPPLYGMGSGNRSWAYKLLPTHRLLERIQGHNRIVQSTLGTPLVGHSFGR